MSHYDATQQLIRCHSTDQVDNDHYSTATIATPDEKVGSMLQPQQIRSVLFS